MAAYVVVVTGGVASGKSAVTSRFEALGIKVADADLAAREVVAIGSDGLAEVVARFGEGFLQTDGSLDRVKMRAHIFNTPNARNELEAIIHPRVRKLVAAECIAATSPYAMAAIPLFTEGGARTAYPWIDRVLLIDVSRDTQAMRLIARDGTSTELAKQMIEAQATRAERLLIADDILNNEGSLDSLDAPIAELDAFYRRLASTG